VFLGEFQHSIDDKGRIKLPAKFKDAFKETAVIMERFDSSLALYPGATFEENIAQRAAEMDELDPSESAMQEDIGASSDTVDLDKGGRILVPSRMREMAGLESEVYLIGNITYLAIWPKEAWEEKRKKNRETRLVRARKMAQKK